MKMVMNETNLLKGELIGFECKTPINTKGRIYIDRNQNPNFDRDIATIEKKVRGRTKNPIIGTQDMRDVYHYTFRCGNGTDNKDLQGKAISMLKMVYLVKNCRRTEILTVADIMNENSIECNHINKDTTDNSIENCSLTRKINHTKWDCEKYWAKHSEEERLKQTKEEHEICTQIIINELKKEKIIWK